MDVNMADDGRRVKCATLNHLNPELRRESRLAVLHVIGPFLLAPTSATGAPTPDSLTLVSSVFRPGPDFSNRRFQTRQHHSSRQPECDLTMRCARLPAAQVRLNFPGCITHPSMIAAVTIPLISSYVWHKDGNVLTESNRITFVGGDLHISSLAASDTGTYTCNASNIHGSKLVNSNLMVTGMQTSGGRCPSLFMALNTILL